MHDGSCTVKTITKLYNKTLDFNFQSYTHITISMPTLENEWPCDLLVYERDVWGSECVDK
jgi:hypothetical protein